MLKVLNNVLKHLSFLFAQSYPMWAYLISTYVGSMVLDFIVNLDSEGGVDVCSEPRR